MNLINFKCFLSTNSFDLSEILAVDDSTIPKTESRLEQLDIMNVFAKPESSKALKSFKTMRRQSFNNKVNIDAIKKPIQSQNKPTINQKNQNLNIPISKRSHSGIKWAKTRQVRQNLIKTSMLKYHLTFKKKDMMSPRNKTIMNLFSETYRKKHFDEEFSNRYYENEEIETIIKSTRCSFVTLQNTEIIKHALE